MKETKEPCAPVGSTSKFKDSIIYTACTLGNFRYFPPISQKLTQADPRWPNLTQADPSWSKLTQADPADPSWPKLIQADSSWPKVTQADHHWWYQAKQLAPSSINKCTHQSGKDIFLRDSSSEDISSTSNILKTHISSADTWDCQKIVC
jgi:hypothetical protein